MKRQSIAIVALSLIAATIVGIVTWNTLSLFRSVDTMEDNTPKSKTANKEIVEEDAPFGEPVIDDDLNKKAAAIDKEAAGLVESNPVKAKAKYLEAATAYGEAGNVGKASEMRANATTVELFIEDSQPEQQG